MSALRVRDSFGNFGLFPKVRGDFPPRVTADPRADSLSPQAEEVALIGLPTTYARTQVGVSQERSNLPLTLHLGNALRAVRPILSVEVIGQPPGFTSERNGPNCIQPLPPSLQERCQRRRGIVRQVLGCQPNCGLDKR